MRLPRFYPIFDNADWLRRALPLGVRLVQIRIKDQSPRKLLGELALCHELCRSHGATLVINDHWQAAIELGCDFVHLGQEDLDTADIAAIRKAGLRLGVSTHDHAELDRALALKPDYIALGPVWPTILKKMKWEQQGLERVSEWRNLVGTTPLVAIGGVTPDRAKQAYAAGADIASAVTDITLNADPEGRIREWLAVAK
ncbi:thiamine phosphate synthase [Paracoccus sp. CPCC 101403]|uniref:Thiamine-phosphate synthase n=1 Tax=Paracoccus broussonetiae TaxID=3075834 RepID=A0ABU3EEN3_9RHOB|nr:thiamine phosphate synthase [Paracoccus sp. CPCC 101403]MDT1062694.1 thiamine phosphate synthase [Paracoccus sp. CPCC 101403]